MNFACKQPFTVLLRQRRAIIIWSCRRERLNRALKFTRRIFYAFQRFSTVSVIKTFAPFPSSIFPFINAARSHSLILPRTVSKQIFGLKFLFCIRKFHIIPDSISSLNTKSTSSTNSDRLISPRETRDKSTKYATSEAASAEWLSQNVAFCSRLPFAAAS